MVNRKVQEYFNEVKKNTWTGPEDSRRCGLPDFDKTVT